MKGRSFRRWSWMGIRLERDSEVPRKKISLEAVAEVQAQDEGIGRVHGGAGGRSGACSNSMSVR